MTKTGKIDRASAAALMYTRPLLAVVWAVALLLLAGCPVSAANGRYVINTSHVGAVNAIAYDASDNLLFSAGDDGTLRAWNPSTGAALLRLQVSSLPVKLMALHPTLPQVAIVETDSISIYRLSVWDWKRGIKLFSRSLSELPLSLGYSPSGNLIVYTQTDWRSVYCIDSQTGAEQPYLQDGFGIVSASRLGATEKKILLYKPSGTLQYRELDTEKLTDQFSTVPDLEDTFFTSDNRYMIGLQGDSLTAVDLTNGAGVASQTVNGVTRIYFDPKSSEVLCYIQDPSGSTSYQLFTFQNGSFVQQYTLLKPPEATLTAFILAQGTVFEATSDGTMYRQSDYEIEPSVFSKNNMFNITDFQVGSSILLTSPQSIITIYSSYLHGKGLPLFVNPSDIILYSQPNPLQQSISIVGFGSNYLLWNPSGQSGEIDDFNPLSGIANIFNADSTSAVLSLDVRDSSLLTVNADGQTAIIDATQGTSNVESTEFGTRTAVFVGGPNIVAAGRRFNTLNTSMFNINLDTGETFPLSDPNSETFGLLYDSTSSTLYSLGIVRDSAGSHTVLASHTGKNFENVSTLLSLPGQDRRATATVDNGAIFFSAEGRNRIRYQQTDQFLTVDDNNNIPVKVQMDSNWLYALNQDGSITIWQRTTGKEIATFYLFKDLSWAIITRDGRLISHGDVSQYVNDTAK